MPTAGFASVNSYGVVHHAGSIMGQGGESRKLDASTMSDHGVSADALGSVYRDEQPGAGR